MEPIDDQNAGISSASKSQMLDYIATVDCLATVAGPLPTSSPMPSIDSTQSPTITCVDAVDWLDNTNTDCSWYSENEEPGCPIWHWFPGNDGLSAGEACCHCASTPTPTSSPGENCENTAGWVDDWVRTEIIQHLCQTSSKK